MTTLIIGTLLGIIPVAAVLSFLRGKKKGRLIQKEDSLVTEKNLEKKILFLESRTENLQREIEDLSKKAEKYLYFLVRLPEAVKQINSNLSFDGLITAIIRLTKDLTGAEAVELYTFEQTSQRLHLVASYGTNREKSVEVRLGEGLIGKAVSMKTIISRGHPGINVSDSEQAGIETASPILFKDSLLGAIAIGKMKEYTGNEKRFLAMLSDLMAVALNNIQNLAMAHEEAITDSLTGLYNKRHFIDKAREILLSSENYDSSFSIFIFDIDHFKNYNDTNGHVQGDVILREMGRLVKEHTRSTNIAARYGGEEFVLLIDTVKNSDDMKCAENIRKLIECHPFPYREKQPLGCISISGGIATFPADGTTLDEVIKHADAALYSSKAAGRNRVTRYEPRLMSEPD